MTDDAGAYRAVLAARRANDAAAAEAALARATEVPIAVARSARDVLALAGELAPAARASALGDVGVALALAGAALDGAAITARANLAEMADAERARRAATQIDGLVADGQARRRRAAEAIARRARHAGS
jgi:formiminotetrahydrofolate cyclodeaminase